MTSTNTINLTGFGDITFYEYAKYEVMYKSSLPNNLTLTNVYEFFTELGYVPDSIIFNANLSDFDGNYPLEFAMYLIDNGTYNHNVATSLWKLTYDELSEYNINCNLIVEKLHHLFPNQLDTLFKYWDPIGENIYINGSNWGTIALARDYVGGKYYTESSMLNFVEKFFGYNFDNITLAKDYVGGKVTPELLSLMVQDNSALMFRSNVISDTDGAIWRHIQQIADNDWVDRQRMCNIIPVLIPHRTVEFFEFVVHLGGYTKYIMNDITDLDINLDIDFAKYPHICFARSPEDSRITVSELFWSDAYLELFDHTIINQPDRISIGFDINMRLGYEAISFVNMGKPITNRDVDCVLSHPEYFHSLGVVLWLQTAILTEGVMVSHIIAFESLTDDQLKQEISSLVATGFNLRTLFQLEFASMFSDKFKNNIIHIFPELHSDFVPTICDIRSGMKMIPGEECLGLNFSTFSGNEFDIPDMTCTKFSEWLNNNEFITAHLPYSTIFLRLLDYTPEEIRFIWNNSNDVSKWVIVNIENNIPNNNLDSLFQLIFLTIHEGADITSYMDLVDGDVIRLIKLF